MGIRLTTWRDSIARWANRARVLFDQTPPLLGSVTVVAIAAGATAGLAIAQDALLTRHVSPLPIQLIRLEVTFSPSRFADMLHAAGNARGDIALSFVTLDAVFPIAYAALFSTVFLWAERWRRITAPPASRPTGDRGTPIRDLLVVAPIAAAAFDILVENVSLWLAASLVPAQTGVPDSTLYRLLVLIGSTGASIKWVLLLFATGGILAELASGPRGVVFWRVRFSVLAVLLGGVPLLAIAQGQDLLRRMFEGDDPIARLFSAVAAPLGAAIVVWYAARKSTEVRFRVNAQFQAIEAADEAWYGFFAEHIPRLLGIALIALVATAFARIGLAAGRFVAVAILGFFAALLSRRGRDDRFAAIGRMVVPRWALPRGWSAVPEFHARVARLLLASLLGIFTFVPSHVATDEDRILLYLRIAAYLCLVAAWVFQLVIRFRRYVAAARASDDDRASLEAILHPPVNSIGNPFVDRPLRRRLVAAAVASAALFVAFTVFPVLVGRALGPLWIVATTAANAVFVGSVTAWIGNRVRVPFVTAALALALLFSLWNDNHVVRILAAQPRNRPSIDERLTEWLPPLQQAAATSGRTPAVILIGAAGGGLRAAYWTAMALATIQDATPAFARHAFAFSGVSGGSVGGALFAALVADTVRQPNLRCAARGTGNGEQPRADGTFVACVHAFMRDDFLSPVLAKLVAPDFLQWFLPFPVGRFDRSIGLERSLEASYESATGRSVSTFDQGFASLTSDPEVRTRVPALMFNSTHVETGRRYITTSVVRDGSSIDAHQFFDARDVLDVLSDAQRGKLVDMRLSTAAHNSARFTYVSPAGHLEAHDGREHGRLVDGGYFENSGLATLREVFDVVRERLDEPPWVLYLCNDPSPCVLETESSPGDSVPSEAADELLSPVRALLKTRDARGSLARESIRAAAQDRFLQLNVCNALPPQELKRIDTQNPKEESSRVQQARDRVVSPPLGWVLSKLARDWMDGSLAGTNPDPTGSCYERNAYALKRLHDIVE